MNSRDKKKICALFCLTAAIVAIIFITRKTENPVKISEIIPENKIAISEGPYEIININDAGVEELELIPGIGETFAARIIEERERKHGFSEINEVKNVKGIGEKRFQMIKKFAGIWKKTKR